MHQILNTYTILSKPLLRIASVLITLHGILHTLGHGSWRKSDNPVQKSIIADMTSHSFPFMGATHCIGDYYEGYGFIISIFLLLTGRIYWVLSNHTPSDFKSARQLTLIVSISLILVAVLELIYFFPFASGITLASAASGLLAIFYKRRHSSTAIN